jgi:hypothetical protein
VADQHLIAGFADSRSIALQAVENADDVVVVVFDQLLAEAHDVRTAGGALPGIALTLSRHYRNGRQRERCRKSNRPKHDSPLVAENPLRHPMSQMDLDSHAGTATTRDFRMLCGNPAPHAPLRRAAAGR